MRRTRRVVVGSAFVALSALVLGCAEREEVYERPIELLDPVVVEDTLVMVDRGGEVAHLVTVNDRSISTRREALPPGPVVAMRRANSKEVMVLSRGERGSAKRDPSPSVLTLLRRSGVNRSYRLGSPFNAVAQSDDGRFAIAYFRQGAELERLLFNPNEIAIVDLERGETDGNPVRRTVRSFGGVPTGVSFSPPMHIPDREPRRIAVVLSNSYVTLIDVDHADRSEITVRLTLPETPSDLGLTHVLFDARGSDIYLRGTGSNDVHVLSLDPVEPASASANDFRPTLNQLAAGSQPSDMVLFAESGERRLLVASPGSSEVCVVDAVSNEVTRIPVPGTVDRIFLYGAASPTDPQSRPRALLFSQKGGNSVVFLDLERIEERKTLNVEALALDRPVLAALPVPERDLVLVVHAASPGAAGLSLLDLTDRTASPVYAEVPLQGATFGTDARTLWIAPPGAERLGWLDLETLHPGEVTLDAPLSRVVTMRDGDLVVAVHASLGGMLTVFPASDPTREAAHAYAGFLLEGLLERGHR